MISDTLQTGAGPDVGGSGGSPGSHDPPSSSWRTATGRYALLVVLVAMYAVFAVLRPDQFGSLDNIRILVSSQAVPLILAVAVTFPLRGGDFDLAIGSTMVLGASIVGVMTQGGVAVWFGVTCALLAGLVVGGLNASLVVGLGLPPFIVTLGTLIAVEGVALALTNAEFISGLPPGLLQIARFRIGGMLPMAVLYGWAIAAVAWYVQERRRLGRHLLFVGWDRSAARRNGVPVARVRTTAFVISGVLSAFAGVVFAGSLGAVDPIAGISFVLTPYAAAFLGMTTITVGRFNVAGTLVGLYLLGVGVSGLQLLGAAFWVADIFNGLALIGAVAFARLVLGPTEELSA